MKNLNLEFNKSYFNGIRYITQDNEIKRRNEELQRRNREIFNTRFFTEDREEMCEEAPYTQSFLMETAYPGMLIGTGYAHEAEGNMDDCIKLGFSFDYVSGQPYIPGSSVKGTLRSCFEQTSIIREFLEAKLATDEKKKAQLETILTDKAIQDLTADIFDGKDIFFDAVLEVGGENNRIIGSDYITPHGEDTTKNPRPLLMAKILPGVVFRFRFTLHDSELLTAEQKKEVFADILSIFGTGAKTNTGYGVLIECKEEEIAHRAAARPASPVTGRAAAPAAPQIRANFAADDAPQISKEQRIEYAAQVIEENKSGQQKRCAVYGCHGYVGDRFIICRNHSQQARSTGKCAICQESSRNERLGITFDFCSRCNLRFNKKY